MDSLTDKEVIFESAEDVFIDDDNHFIFDKNDIDIEQTIGINELRDKLKCAPTREMNGRYYTVITKNDERSHSLGFFNHRKRFMSDEEEFTIIKALHKLQNITIIKKNNIISSIYLVLLHLFANNIILPECILDEYFIEISKSICKPNKLKKVLITLYQTIQCVHPIETLDMNKLQKYPNSSIHGLVRGFIWDFQNKLREINPEMLTKEDNSFLKDTSSFINKFELGLRDIVLRLYSANTKMLFFGSNIKKYDLVARLTWRVYQLIRLYLSKKKSFSSLYKIPLQEIDIIQKEIYHNPPRWDYVWDYVSNETTPLIETLQKIPDSNTRIKSIKTILKENRYAQYKKKLDSGFSCGVITKNRRQYMNLIDNIDHILKTRVLFGQDFIELIEEHEKIITTCLEKILPIFAQMDAKHTSTLFGFKKKILEAMDVGFL